MLISRGEIAVAPMDQVIALPLNHCLRFAIPGRCWRDKQINENVCAFGKPEPQPSGHQGNQGVRQPKENRHPRDRRTGSCKIKLGIEPWFNSVLIRGCHVGEMIGHERADVTGDELRRQGIDRPRFAAIGAQR